MFTLHHWFLNRLDVWPAYLIHVAKEVEGSSRSWARVCVNSIEVVHSKWSLVFVLIRRRASCHVRPTWWVDSNQIEFCKVNNLSLNFISHIYISAPLTRKGSHAENKASHGRKQRFFSNVLNSVVFYYTWFRKPNVCIQAMSKQYTHVYFRVLGRAGEHAQKPKFRSVQFLAS